ncbi:AzlD family protein [Rhizobium sp. RAF56]|jgi:uncharacterized membrane protein|uniref:AzlD family protein n=1 Tax=Rhizobium sp. RAF56 TaxID=3233062 RepID=UPI003F96238D
MSFDPYMVSLIAAAAVVTYLTRIGGYLMIMRMSRIPPRMEAALNAVPAAVLTTLAAPAFFDGSIAVKAGMLLALFIGWRFSHMLMLVAGWALVLLLRHFAGL